MNIISRLNASQKYELCSKNDSYYDGKFYMGVLTTGIFCLPSCKARLPLRKNVKFYESKKAAIAAGLRGCRRCRSAYYPKTQPEWFDNLLVYMSDNLDMKLDTEHLEQNTGVDISTVRRYFKEYMHTTPARYHISQRLKKARALLKSGMNLIDVAHSTGFSSLSGFRYAYEKKFGNITEGES